MAPRQPLTIDAPLHRKRNPITGFRIPDLIKQGEIVSDVTKKKWKLGKSIGVGAFGDIYLASDDISKPVGSEAKYVIKMEPHKSGPLFVEMNFYLRATKESSISEWTTKKRIKRLGMPKIYGFGSHTLKGEKMRFIVLPKYGESIYKVFLRNSQRLHIKTALTLGCYVIDVLEYIHSQGYIHSDIKSLNLVLGSDAPVYLIDYGLVCKFQYRDGTHKEYTPDGRKADVGTLEYSGRDAHIGVISRRSDLESLGYNLISWLGGKLPWEDYEDSEVVTEMKDEAMSNVRAFLNSVFSPKLLGDGSLAVLAEYLDYVSKLDFNTEPDYLYCKRLLSHGIRKAGFVDDLKLTFESHAKLNKEAIKKSENWSSLKKKKINTKSTTTVVRKPCAVHTADNIISPRVTRAIGKKKKNKKKRFDWASVLAGHPERDIKKDKIKELSPSRIISPSNIEKSCISNPTSAMLQVMERRKRRFSDSSRRSKAENESFSTLNGSYCTPAMREILEKKSLASPETISPRVTRSTSRLSRSTVRSRSMSSPRLRSCSRQRK